MAMCALKAGGSGDIDVAIGVWRATNHRSRGVSRCVNPAAANHQAAWSLSGHRPSPTAKIRSHSVRRTACLDRRRAGTGRVGAIAVATQQNEKCRSLAANRATSALQQFLADLNGRYRIRTYDPTRVMRVL